ncbi:MULTISPECIES: DUF3850 domain-containing protein [Hymenobacter]|nr:MULTISPECIES: DUF3850 domain-containing protein [Hymenobacter]MBC6989031.1 DUF3850 domain-containing protein [Hymenobacter sp. BT491]
MKLTMIRHTSHFNLHTGPTPYRTHELEIGATEYAALEAGTRPFDVRYNDRDYQVGDALILREYEQDSGRTLLRWVSTVVHGGHSGLEHGWCILGLSERAPLPPGILDTKLW